MNNHIDAVRKMQIYIANHLNEAITLADLARECAYSPWYARRLFLKHQK